MERITKKRKLEFSKRRVLVISAIFILLIIGIIFLINRLLPIKNISEDDISIKLSTTKITGKSVTATITTKTKYDIFYYIDSTTNEEEYYEGEVPEETSTTTDSSKSEKIEVKEIDNKKYQKVNNSKIEIEKNGIVYLKYSRFGKLSSIPYVFEIKNIDKEGPEIGEITTKSTSTSITVTANVIDETETDLQYYFRLADSNIYISTGYVNTYTFKNLTTDENYIIYVKVTDKFGNASEAVTEATASDEVTEDEVIVQKVYHFKVNLGANTVTVYEKDENGEFTKPVKAFICSTGKATPKSGKYTISNKYRWRSLFGNVYGQYAVRITGNILFHSVPYEKMYPNTLEYEEFDKLGTSASMGCIRLCVRDAKWIYDNAKAGSTVEFYSNSSNPGPLGKPTIQKISNNKAYRDWDPTDPDKHNPWNGGDGKVTKAVIVDENPTQNTVSNKVVNKTSNTVTNTVTNTVSDTTTNNYVEQPVENKVPDIPSENTVTQPTNTVVEPDSPEENTNTVTTPPEENDPTPPPPSEQTNTVTPPISVEDHSEQSVQDAASDEIQVGN